MKALQFFLSETYQQKSNKKSAFPFFCLPNHLAPNKICVQKVPKRREGFFFFIFVMCKRFFCAKDYIFLEVQRLLHQRKNFSAAWNGGKNFFVDQFFIEIYFYGFSLYFEIKRKCFIHPLPKFVVYGEVFHSLKIQ